MTRMLAFGVICLIGGISLCATGQDVAAPAAAAAAPPAAPASPAPGAPAAAPAVAPVPSPAVPAASEPKGDAITLKSGREIKGVQIVGKTPSEIRVQVTPEVVFGIPKSQIDRIEEDGFDPRTGQSSASGGEAPKGSMISGEKLSPEVFENLSKPLPDPAPKYDNKDLVEALAELSRKTGVPMVVDGSVMELPAKEREWTVSAKPGTTLMGLLQEELLRKFKKLAVVYQYDKLLIVTKEKANTPGAAKPSEEAASAKPGEAPAAAAASGAAPAGPAATPTPAPAGQAAATPPAQPAAEAAKAPADSGAPASSAPRQRRRAGAPAN